MRKLDLFIGPCVLESEALAFEIAERLLNDLKPIEDKINLCFKGSFDKANRSSIDSYRGPGIDEGLKILENVKKKFSLDTITDFHLPEQAEVVSKVVDVMQIPAFLCRQTDIIVAGAKWSKINNCKLKIKKGQFLSPYETKNIVEKASSILPLEQIYLTERGSSFGYNNLIVDMSSFLIMKSFGVKAIHDATHCVQMPGSTGKTTGGKRELIPTLAKAAIAAGADGIFMEAHPHPHLAKSDSTTCLPLDTIYPLVNKLISIYEVVNE